MIQNDTKSLVPTVYYDMFYLRLLGFTYKQIAERTGYSETHVRRLFAENGALNALWKQWLSVAKDNAIEESITLMFGNLNGVVRALVDTAQKGGLSSVAASRILLTYTLGDPEKHARKEPDNSPKNFGEWALEQSLRLKGVDEQEIKKQLAGLRNYK